MVALVARFHAKGRPRKSDVTYETLNSDQRRTVRWLAAIMQIVEGLDRSHYQLVKSLRVTRGSKRIAILVTARRDARLEFWAARRRTALLERLLDKPVKVQLDPARQKRVSTTRAKPGRKAVSQKRTATGRIIPLPRRAKGRSA
jgi:exopolyphosphatase/guanosine-5'-triphosphate,3'-diphosphate pyrophosphatase